MRSMLACLLLFACSCGSSSSGDTRPERPRLTEDTERVDSSGKAVDGDGVYECMEDDGNWLIYAPVQQGAPVVYHCDDWRCMGPDEWVITDTLRVSCTEGETVHVKWL